MPSLTKFSPKGLKTIELMSVGTAVPGVMVGNGIQSIENRIIHTLEAVQQIDSNSRRRVELSVWRMLDRSGIFRYSLLTGYSVYCSAGTVHDQKPRDGQYALLSVYEVVLVSLLVRMKTLQFLIQVALIFLSFLSLSVLLWQYRHSSL